MINWTFGKGWLPSLWLIHWLAFLGAMVPPDLDLLGISEYFGFGEPN